MNEWFQSFSVFSEFTCNGPVTSVRLGFGLPASNQGGEIQTQSPKALLNLLYPFTKVQISSALECQQFPQGCHPFE